MKLKIKGKMVECRKLRKLKDSYRKTDFYHDGTQFDCESLIGHLCDGSLKIYRLISPKKAGKAIIKPVKAWGIVENGVLKLEAFPNRVGAKWKINSKEECIRVLITPLRTASTFLKNAVPKSSPTRAWI